MESGFRDENLEELSVKPLLHPAGDIYPNNKSVQTLQFSTNCAEKEGGESTKVERRSTFLELGVKSEENE